MIEDCETDDDDKSTLTGPARYGRYYWCVHTKASGTIYLNADRTRITPSGDLEFIRDAEGDRPEHINLALAAGCWTVCFAASCFSDEAIAVESWEGKTI
jgi:hypothetical protein